MNDLCEQDTQRKGVVGAKMMMSKSVLLVVVFFLLPLGVEGFVVETVALLFTLGFTFAFALCCGCVCNMLFTGSLFTGSLLWMFAWVFG